jgi:hypothetical protein
MEADFQNQGAQVAFGCGRSLVPKPALNFGNRVAGSVEPHCVQLQI